MEDTTNGHRVSLGGCGRVSLGGCGSKNVLKLIEVTAVKFSIFVLY
jgi:hypothetical protein